MNEYSHALEQYHGKINVEKLITKSKSELNELEDYYSERSGWQNHRTAVVGKKLRAMVHGRNIYNQTGFPYSLVVRVDGQYTDYATTYMECKTDADALAAEFNVIRPIGLEA